MKKFMLSIVFVVALAISASAQTADQHFKAGLEFYDTKAYDQAITSFSAAISLNPSICERLEMKWKHLDFNQEWESRETQVIVSACLRGSPSRRTE